IPLHFGQFGGQYILEALFDYLIKLEGAYNTMQNDLTVWPKFRSQYGYMNPPSKLYFAESLTKYANSAPVWLRREYLYIPLIVQHNWPHLILHRDHTSNAVGQVCICLLSLNF
ncbi:hypothetical protein F5141DRAFT_997591, partial [Pisolithus sp. B1]